MDLNYCSMKCPVGKKVSSELLDKHESVFGAALAFEVFTNKCAETCQYKAELEKENHKLKVCCISAKARHGKDTAGAMMAEYLESKGKKVLITHFADLVKYVCTKFFGWNGDKDEAGRTLLQHIGTDVVGDKQPEYWANFIVDILKFFENEWDYVLIPDCRYPWEVSTMEDNFETVVLRVERPGFESNLTEAQKQHASEVMMDDYPFDAILYNDSDLDTFKDKVEWFVDNYLIN